MALITIFGGSGMLAKHITPFLARKKNGRTRWGHQIRLACRHPEKANRLKVAGDVGQITPIACNVNDPVAVRAALDGSDIVINLVGILAQSEAQHQYFDDLHAAAPKTIADAALEAGVKTLIHVSAIGADLESPAHYARSKAAGEQAIIDAFASPANKHKSKYVILRPSVVFSPEDKFTTLFGKMIALCPVLPLVGGGATKFQPIYAEDIARVIEQIVDAPQAIYSGIYELGGPEVLSLRQIHELIADLSGQNCSYVPLPFSLAKPLGAVLGILPNPLLTLDQVKLLQSDNIVGKNAKKIEEFHVIPQSMRAVMPNWLDQFQKTGRFRSQAR